MQEKFELKKFDASLDAALKESSQNEPLFQIEAIIPILSLALQAYIKSIVPDEEILNGREMTHTVFGIEGAGLPDTPYISNLTPMERNSFIEALRAAIFILQFDFDTFAVRHWPSLMRMQIKLYALSSHINQLSLDPVFKELMNVFFKKAFPIFHPEASLQELNNIDADTIYGTYWYDRFLLQKRKPIIGQEIHHIPNLGGFKNYVDLLDFILHLPTDTLTQFLFIESIWNRYEIQRYVNKEFIPEWLKVLKKHSNEGNVAAAFWLGIGRRVGILLSKERTVWILFSEENYGKFSTADHLAVIKYASFFPSTEKSNRFYLRDYIVWVLEPDIKIQPEKKLTEYIDFFKSCNKDYLFQIMVFTIFIELLEKNRPEMVKLIRTASLETARFLQSLIDSEPINPLVKNHIKNKIQVLAAPSIKQSTEEIKRNAKLLGKEKRNPDSFFSALPDEVLVKIAAKTKTTDFQSEGEAEKIATESLDKPKSR